MAQTAFFEFFLTNLRFVLASGAENGLKTWFLNPAIFAILHNVRDLRDWNTKWSAKRASKMQKKEAKLPFHLLFQRSGRDSNPRAVARKLISSRRYARDFQAIFGIFGSVRPHRKWLKNVDFGRSDQKKPQKYSYRPESTLSSVLAQNKLFSAKKQELWQEHQPFQWHIENGLLQGSKHWHIELAHWTLLLRTNII